MALLRLSALCAMLASAAAFAPVGASIAVCACAFRSMHVLAACRASASSCGRVSGAALAHLRQWVGARVCKAGGWLLQAMVPLSSSFGRYMHSHCIPAAPGQFVGLACRCDAVQVGFRSAASPRATGGQPRRQCVSSAVTSADELVGTICSRMLWMMPSSSSGRSWRIQVQLAATYALLVWALLAATVNGLAARSSIPR